LENYRWILSFPVAHRAFINNIVVGIGSATSVVLLTAVIACIFQHRPKSASKAFHKWEWGEEGTAKG